MPATQIDYLPNRQIQQRWGISAATLRANKQLLRRELPAAFPHTPGERGMNAQCLQVFERFRTLLNATGLEGTAIHQLIKEAENGDFDDD